MFPNILHVIFNIYLMLKGGRNAGLENKADVYMLVSYRLALFKASDFKTLLCHGMPGTHAVHHGN